MYHFVYQDQLQENTSLANPIVDLNFYLFIFIFLFLTF